LKLVFLAEKLKMQGFCFTGIFLQPAEMLLMLFTLLFDY